MASANRPAPANVPRPSVPRPGETRPEGLPIKPRPIIEPPAVPPPPVALPVPTFAVPPPPVSAGERPKLKPVPLPWKKPAAAAPKVDPAVLLVGADEAFLPAIQEHLGRYDVFVETTDVATVVETVVAAAPDLVMLMGEAAKDCGFPVLQRLASSPQSAVVPVVILDDNTALDARLRAFRHGAAAIIPRSASVNAIADQVAKLAREIPERHGSTLGEVGDTTLHEFVETLARELRSGILSVKTGGGDDTEAVRLVLGQGRPLADLIDDFVNRARRHILAAEPLHYEFDEHVSGTVKMLDTAKADSERSPEDLTDVRIALADADAARADTIAQELRALGAFVVVTDLRPNDVRFARMRQLDPEILIIGEEHVQGEGYDLVRRMRRDTRLRWASMLVVRWGEIWSEMGAAPVTAVRRIAGTLAALADPEATLRARAAEAHGFDTRLEVTGPARCLRALTQSGASVRVAIKNPRLAVEFDIADRLVVGVTAQSAEGERFEGPTAIAGLVQLSSGRVTVTQVQNPATANMMTTVDVALNMADAEQPPIAPSLPAGPPSSPPESIKPQPVLAIRDLTQTGALSVPPSAASPISVAPASLPPSHAAVEPTPSLAPGSSFAEETTPDGVSHAARVRARNPLTTGVSRELSRNGISPLTAGLLVLLAVAQGLIFVFVWRSMNAPFPLPAKTGEVAAAQPKKAKPATLAKPPAVAAPSKASKPEAALPPAEKSKPESEAELPRVDGSGRNAPTCEDVWAQNPPRDGNYPGAAYAQSRQANRWITRGDVDRAQHAYCLAVHWDKENVGFLVGLGHLFLLRRDGEQAIPVLKKALELNADSKRAMDLLGDAYAHTGEYDEARKSWLAASGSDPGDLAAQRSLAMRDLRRGQSHLERRELVHAERMFRRASIMNPKSVVAAVGLSDVLTALDDAKAAKLWAKYAIDLDPRNPEARVALGDALHKLGDTEGARVEYKEAQLLDPSHREANRRLRGLDAG